MERDDTVAQLRTVQLERDDAVARLQQLKRLSVLQTSEVRFKPRLRCVHVCTRTHTHTHKYNHFSSEEEGLNPVTASTSKRTRLKPLLIYGGFWLEDLEKLQIVLYVLPVF